MCIIFIYNGTIDPESEYSLIVATNRDEYYRRPSENLAPWSEDQNIIGGRDLEGGGTWLAISPMRKKLGVLLNLPRNPKPNAKSRGKLVADYVKDDTHVKDYIEGMKGYVEECNGFVFIAVEFGNLSPSIHTYSNATGILTTHKQTTIGFGNSLPDMPLKKVVAGSGRMHEICKKMNKVALKEELVDQLIGLLKSEDRHLPDPELERRSNAYEHLSSIFVCIPEGGYGTRTHTIILITKTGCVDVIEISLQAPIDVQNLNWQRSEYQFGIIKNNL